MHIVIIGAGIVGITAAHALIEDGHTVTLVDRGEPGAAASRGNAGQIAHADILPLATPSMIWKVAGWLADPLGPLTVRPTYLPALAPFLVRFLLASRPKAVERSTSGIIPLQRLSLPAWERLLSRLDLEAELKRHGTVYAFDSRPAFDAMRRTYGRQRDLGIEHELLDGHGVRRLEPALGPTLVAGAYFPTVAHVKDPYRLCQLLVEALRQRGARIEQATVKGLGFSGDSRPLVVLEGGRSLEPDRVVLAAGAWSKSFARAAGDHVPLETERGYNATLTAPGVAFTRPVHFEGHGFVLTPLEAGLRIGGAVELAGTEAAPSWRRVDAMLTKAKRFIPGLTEDGRSNWMGCRPSLPDSLPVIGRSRRSPHVIHAFGHGHHGLTQAAATAELVAALVGDRAPAIDLAPCSAQRF
jgi:D-amino-acid dehydrogenase